MKQWLCHYEAKHSKMCRKAHFIAEGNFAVEGDLMFQRNAFPEKTANSVSKLTFFSGKAEPLRYLVCMKCIIIYTVGVTSLMQSSTSFIEDNIILCPLKQNDVQALPETVFATLLQNDVVPLRTQTQKNTHSNECVFFWCPRPGSNRYVFEGHGILSPGRLPVPPLGQANKVYHGRNKKSIGKLKIYI